MKILLGMLVLLFGLGNMVCSIAADSPQTANPAFSISPKLNDKKQWQFLYNQNRVLQGWFTADGSLYNAYGVLRGWITSEGEIYSHNGILLGRLDSAGSIYNYDGILMGWLTSEGSAYDQDGIFQGWLTPEGFAYSQRRILIGYGKVDNQKHLGIYFFFLEKLGLSMN